MSGELFRTNIVTRDPRYPLIIATCNYSLAGLFLGMFFTLAGVMLTSVTDQKPSSDIAGQSNLTYFMGVALLVSGCLLILSAVATLFVASCMYLRTKTEAPSSGEEPESVWSYLDNLPEKSSSSRSEAPISETTLQSSCTHSSV